MSWPFSSLAPALSLSELCWETESLGGSGVETVFTRGGLEAPGLRAPPLRAWWRGREDMEMELIPELGEAIRLGSLHTEVGGATRAMSGIGEKEKEERRGGGGGLAASSAEAVMFTCTSL